MIYQKTFQADELPSKAHISCFRYKTRDFDYYPIHSHSYYEISFIVSGERYFYFNGEQLKIDKNTLLFVPPLAAHGNKNITAVDDIVLQISANLFNCISERFDSKMFFALKNDSCASITLEDGSEISAVINRLYDLCDRIDGSYDDKGTTDNAVMRELERDSLVLKLVSLMIEFGLIAVKSGVSSLSKLGLIDELINRLIANPHDKIDMTEAAKFVGMSYSHFSRLFKALTGTNYAEYCNILRIRHAEELLRDTNLSIAQVAYAIGIDTPSYFTRLFKNINGISPAEYRAKR